MTATPTLPDVDVSKAGNISTLHASVPAVSDVAMASPTPVPASTGGLLSTLKDNPMFGAGFGLLGVGAAMALFRQAAMRASVLARRYFLVTLEIPSRDKSYLWFLQWMSSQGARQRVPHLAVETVFKQHENGSVSTEFSLVPGVGKHFFRWKGAWMQVQRQRDSRLMDLTTGNPYETITITTLSRDRALLNELLIEARAKALERQEGKTVIFCSYGPEWRPFGQPRKRRPLASVILDKGLKEAIVKDVKNFLNNGKWYLDRGKCVMI
jgi:chaperone BCS1